MIKAALLSILLASPDGGVLSDAPLVDPPSAVVEVRSAITTDGGVLPDGWWVSRGQMLKLGTKLTECENRPAQASTVTWGFWAGLGLGAAAAAIGIVAVSNAIGR